MQRLALATLLLLLGYPPVTLAQDACLVVSHDNAATREAVAAFHASFPGHVTEIVLPEATAGDARLEQAEQARFSVHVAIGSGALARLSDLPRNRPLLFGLVVDPQGVVHDRPNVGGVPMMPSPRFELETLRDMVPTVRRILTIYSLPSTEPRVEEGRRVAESLGLELTALRADDAEHAARLLRDQLGSYDAFWMQPDRRVLSPDLIEYLLLASYQRRTPVVAIARSLVERGFLFSMSPVAREVGTLLGQMADRVAGGSHPTLVAVHEPELAVNLKTARILGITVPPSVRARATITY